MSDLHLSFGPGCPRLGDHRQTGDTMSVSRAGLSCQRPDTRPGDPADGSSDDPPGGPASTSLELEEVLDSMLGAASLHLPLCWASGWVSLLAVSTATVSVYGV